MGTIQAAALTVLTEADGPLAPRQVRARAQALLELTVSQDTISSFLSVACRNGRFPWCACSAGCTGSAIRLVDITRSSQGASTWGPYVTQLRNVSTPHLVAGQLAIKAPSDFPTSYVVG